MERVRCCQGCSYCLQGPKIISLYWWHICLSCIRQAQNRTTYYAPNQIAQMRPNPRWQQQGGRGQGEPVDHDGAHVCDILNIMPILALFVSVLSSLPGGFQAMPSSLRQPGPRANLRHMSPSSSTQGPRGAFTQKQHQFVDYGFGIWNQWYWCYTNVFRVIKTVISSSWLLAGGQSMGPRPSVGVPGPRAMPPYKYATGVRNPNPQVVQPIALQQVSH